MKKANDQPLSIPLWKQAAAECGIVSQKFEQFSNAYLTSDTFVDNVLRKIEEAMGSENEE